MKEDLADQYTISKWMNSISLGKKTIRTMFIAGLLGGLAFTATDWAWNKINQSEENETTTRPYYPALSFIEGSVVAAATIYITRRITHKSEQDDRSNG